MSDLHARVLVVSDRVSRGEAEDRGGPAVRAALEAAGFGVDEVMVVEDGAASVNMALLKLADGFAGLIATTGGTGFAPRDQTPEGTRAAIEREAPGLAEAMRAVDPRGRLSRGVAGTLAATLIVNLPGSPGGAVDHLAAILDVVPHALALLADTPTSH